MCLDLRGKGNWTKTQGADHSCSSLNISSSFLLQIHGVTAFPATFEPGEAREEGETLGAQAQFAKLFFNCHSSAQSSKWLLPELVSLGEVKAQETHDNSQCGTRGEVNLCYFKAVSFGSVCYCNVTFPE